MMITKYIVRSRKSLKLAFLAGRQPKYLFTLDCGIVSKYFRSVSGCRLHSIENVVNSVSMVVHFGLLFFDEIKKETLPVGICQYQ